MHRGHAGGRCRGSSPVLTVSMIAIPIVSAGLLVRRISPCDRRRPGLLRVKVVEIGSRDARLDNGHVNVLGRGKGAAVLHRRGVEAAYRRDEVSCGAASCPGSDAIGSGGGNQAS